jgi:cytochrome c oxidase subunit 3
MSEVVLDGGAEAPGKDGFVEDWSKDKQVFGVPWGKAMMWIFLLSDTFIFSCFLVGYMSVFLVGYMSVRIATTDPWPNPSEVFALEAFGYPVPLLLIAIMTFVLITSSGTMALAVNMGYRKDRNKTFWLMVVTALLGATFVGMQAFEWTKLISEGVRPWENPFGAAQFGSSFFMITGFHGMHVSAGVIYLLVIAFRVRNGYYEKRGGNYEIVEITGLYWHFVDLVWVFIFALFYLW